MAERSHSQFVMPSGKDFKAITVVLRAGEPTDEGHAYNRLG